MVFGDKNCCDLRYYWLGEDLWALFFWHLRRWAMAYGLARWKIRLLAIARQTALTPAQVLLAWAIQRGTAVLTTAKTLDHC